MKKIKGFLLIITIIISLGTTDVLAYTKASEEFKKCAANCDRYLNADGSVKENQGQSYTACMSPCNTGLDSTKENNKKQHEKRVENAKKSPVEFCAKTAIIWQIVGWVLLVIKIILPLIIIILASIDFFKAVMSGKDSDITASLKGVLWRFVSAVIIFFIPTIVGIVMSLISNFSDSGAKSDYNVCKTCILDPADCDTSKDAGKN